MTSGFDGRTILVIAAGGGIGSVVAERFAAVGAHVVAAARSVDSLGEVAGRITSAGGAVTTIAMDVTDESSVAAGIASAARVSGRIDAMVNTAGVFRPPGRHRDVNVVAAR